MALDEICSRVKKPQTKHSHSSAWLPEDVPAVLVLCGPDRPHRLSASSVRLVKANAERDKKALGVLGWRCWKPLWESGAGDLAPFPHQRGYLRVRSPAMRESKIPFHNAGALSGRGHHLGDHWGGRWGEFLHVRAQLIKGRTSEIACRSREPSLHTT